MRCNECSGTKMNASVLGRKDIVRRRTKATGTIRLTQLNDGVEYHLVHPSKYIVEWANQKSIDVGSAERYKKLSTPEYMREIREITFRL